jgi:hypothetical protein
VQNLGMQVTLMAGAVGVVLALLPAGFLNGFCRLLRWPTPREYETHVRGAAAGIRGLLSRVLFHQFGVAEAQKLALV